MNSIHFLCWHSCVSPEDKRMSVISIYIICIFNLGSWDTFVVVSVDFLFFNLFLIHTFFSYIFYEFDLFLSLFGVM